MKFSDVVELLEKSKPILSLLQDLMIGLCVLLLYWISIGTPEFPIVVAIIVCGQLISLAIRSRR